jgi:hypothetical protein
MKDCRDPPDSCHWRRGCATTWACGKRCVNRSSLAIDVACECRILSIEHRPRRDARVSCPSVLHRTTGEQRCPERLEVKNSSGCREMTFVAAKAIWTGLMVALLATMCPEQPHDWGSLCPLRSLFCNGNECASPSRTHAQVSFPRLVYGAFLKERLSFIFNAIFRPCTACEPETGNR